jgi:pimeloyl-ACP methyl ester carboxylesterase
MIRRANRIQVVVVACGLLVVAGCSSSSSDVSAETSRSSSTETVPVTSAVTSDPADDPDVPVTDEPAVFAPAPIEWDDFNDSVDVALLDVPVDYDDPSGPQFELYLARHRARDVDRRIGTLLVNPGGPGFGGSDFAFFAGQIFDEALLDRFDIVGWDPRGTGESEPAIDCIDDYDPYFTAIDATPDDAAEAQAYVQVAKDFAGACLENNQDIIEYVGTNNSARDMDAIRQALGEETISYFGFSYGSELGAAWATLFPDTVRAAVLDGASDPNADSFESTVQQLVGFESSLTTFLARCSADPTCAFHHDGDAESAFDALMASLDANPVVGDPDRPPVNRDVAITAVVQAMYSESFWPALERSLADAELGDGAGLLALNDSYYQRQPDGTYGNELEAFQAISCADSDERQSVEEADAEASEFSAVAPRLAPEGSAGGYFCTFFPPSVDPRVDITGAGAGPIVVIGTTGDPATPFESTVTMSNTLEDGRLVIVEADQHTGYGVNRCVIDVVNAYLVDLEAPDDETECR